MDLFPITNYEFTSKKARPSQDVSLQARMIRLARNYQANGIRHTAYAVMLAHHRKHPHVLIIQYSGKWFELPGG